jgi:uncharacterized membrane protein YcaP (DUF421 family)
VITVANALIGHWGQLGWVAFKALLLFVVAVIGLRASARRTFAELTLLDFVTAVAVGAVVGRVPNASATSFVAGAATLLVLLVMHRLLGRARMIDGLSRVLDHPPALLVRHGRVDRRTLRKAQLTSDDLASLLRARGVVDLSDVDYVIFEPGGNVSVIRAQQSGGGLVLPLIGEQTSEIS